jgi:hypothetical protein
MKFILLSLLLLISISTKSDPLPQWIAAVPVYPNPTMFDPHITMEECGMFGNMASAVQIVRRDTRDALGTFLVRMPEELNRDNYGFPQPIVTYYYSQIGEWTYTNYDMSVSIDDVLYDYTKQCLRQSMPTDMNKWFELKKREATEQEKPSWGA